MVGIDPLNHSRRARLNGVDCQQILKLDAPTHAVDLTRLELDGSVGPVLHNSSLRWLHYVFNNTRSHSLSRCLDRVYLCNQLWLMNGARFCSEIAFPARLAHTHTHTHADTTVCQSPLVQRLIDCARRRRRRRRRRENCLGSDIAFELDDSHWFYTCNLSLYIKSLFNTSR